jgi:outer membrane protein
MTRKILSTMSACLILAAGFYTQTSSQTVTLEQVIREVCTKSDSVKMMKESIIKADEMVREKWSNALPKISATGYAGESYGSAFGGSGGGGTQSPSPLEKKQAGPSGNQPAPQDTVTYGAMDTAIGAAIKDFSQKLIDGISSPQTATIYSAGISITQPIFTFGKIGTAIKVANSFNKSAHCSYTRNMQTLQLGALDMYFRTIMAYKSAQIAERALSRKKELNSFLQRNFDLGSGSKAQVMATKADVANQSSAVLIAKRDAATARMMLNAMMGRPLVDSTALDTSSVSGSPVNGVVPAANEAVQSALANRADIQSLKYLAESTRGGAKIYKALYLPSIAATGSAGWSKYQAGSGSFLSTNGNANWSLGVGAQWTLFDGFSNSAKARQYLSDANKLDITNNTISNMVEIDVRSAIMECAAADSNLSASREMLGSAQASYDLTNSNFKQGSGQFADLQLADELLQQAELGMINANYRLVRSRAALQVAMGNDIVKLN